MDVSKPDCESHRCVSPAHGFTLMEMVIVVLVVSILAVNVTLRWPASSINLGAQAHQVANDIRYTQSLAMTNGQRYYLIRQSATTYQILSSAGTPVSFPLGNTTATLNSGITFGSWSNLPSNLIAFDAEGTPYTTSSSPGTALASNATIPLVSGSNTVSISILAGTGRVTVS